MAGIIRLLSTNNTTSEIIRHILSLYFNLYYCISYFKLEESLFATILPLGVSFLMSLTWASAADRLQCLTPLAGVRDSENTANQPLTACFRLSATTFVQRQLGLVGLPPPSNQVSRARREKNAMTGQRAAPWEGKKEDRSVCRAVRCLLASIDLADASIPADDRQFYPFRRERWKKARISLRPWF